MTVIARSIRRQELHFTETGVIPTVPVQQATDPTHPEWLPTDIMEGEICFNRADNVFFTRLGNEIVGPFKSGNDGSTGLLGKLIGADFSRWMFGYDTLAGGEFEVDDEVTLTLASGVITGVIKKMEEDIIHVGEINIESGDMSILTGSIDNGAGVTANITINGPSDLKIPLTAGTRMIVTDILFTKPSVAHSAAALVMFYSEANRSGNLIGEFPALWAYLATSDQYINDAAARKVSIGILVDPPNYSIDALYMTNDTANGAPMTADIYVFGFVVE